MKFVVGKPRRKKLLRRLRSRWVKNMNVTYDVILVSQNGIQFRAFASIVISLGV
jgi:hypothetical protein